MTQPTINVNAIDCYLQSATDQLRIARKLANGSAICKEDIKSLVASLAQVLDAMIEYINVTGGSEGLSVLTEQILNFSYLIVPDPGFRVREDAVSGQLIEMLEAAAAASKNRPGDTTQLQHDGHG